jgi:hypothetical protein
LLLACYQQQQVAVGVEGKWWHEKNEIISLNRQVLFFRFFLSLGHSTAVYYTNKYIFSCEGISTGCSIDFQASSYTYIFFYSFAYVLFLPKKIHKLYTCGNAESEREFA